MEFGIIKERYGPVRIDAHLTGSCRMKLWAFLFSGVAAVVLTRCTCPLPAHLSRDWHLPHYSTIYVRIQKDPNNGIRSQPHENLLLALYKTGHSFLHLHTILTISWGVWAEGSKLNKTIVTQNQVNIFIRRHLSRSIVTIRWVLVDGTIF